MKRNYVYFLFTYLLTFVVSGCDTDIEPEVIQAANTYNEEYYQNLFPQKDRLSDRRCSKRYYARTRTGKLLNLRADKQDA